MSTVPRQNRRRREAKLHKTQPVSPSSTHHRPVWGEHIQWHSTLKRIREGMIQTFENRTIFRTFDSCDSLKRFPYTRFQESWNNCCCSADYSGWHHHRRGVWLRASVQKPIRARARRKTWRLARELFVSWRSRKKARIFSVSERERESTSWREVVDFFNRTKRNAQSTWDRTTPENAHRNQLVLDP